MRMFQITYSNQFDLIKLNDAATKVVLRYMLTEEHPDWLVKIKQCNSAWCMAFSNHLHLNDSMRCQPNVILRKFDDVFVNGTLPDRVNGSIWLFSLLDLENLHLLFAGQDNLQVGIVFLETIRIILYARNDPNPFVTDANVESMNDVPERNPVCLSMRFFNLVVHRKKPQEALAAVGGLIRALEKKEIKMGHAARSVAALPDDRQ